MRIHLSLGRSVSSVVVSLANNISHCLSSHSKISLYTEKTGIITPSWEAAHILADALLQGASLASAPRHVGVSTPDDKGVRLLASLGIANRYEPVVVEVPGAKFGTLRVRDDLTEAPALLGVSTIEPLRSPGSLGIGIWSQYVHPRLAIPLTHPARREPDTADAALGVSPAVVGTLLIAFPVGYVACVWSTDLVAAELAGLALWQTTLPAGLEGIGPWEDPVVQRATELGLGVLLPSDLELRTVWAGKADDKHGSAILSTLASTMSTLLNIEADPHPSF